MIVRRHLINNSSPHTELHRASNDLWFALGEALDDQLPQSVKSLLNRELNGPIFNRVWVGAKNAIENFILTRRV